MKLADLGTAQLITASILKVGILVFTSGGMEHTVTKITWLMKVTSQNKLSKQHSPPQYKTFSAIMSMLSQ